MTPRADRDVLAELENRMRDIPPAARDILAELARRLRDAPARANGYVEKLSACGGGPWPIKSGCYEAIMESVALDLERLLVIYAPNEGDS